MLTRATPAHAYDYKNHRFVFRNYTCTCHIPFVLATLFSYELIRDHLYICLHKRNGSKDNVNATEANIIIILIAFQK